MDFSSCSSHDDGTLTSILSFTVHCECNAYAWHSIYNGWLSVSHKPRFIETVEWIELVSGTEATVGLSYTDGREFGKDTSLWSCILNSQLLTMACQPFSSIISFHVESLAYCL